ncbi:thiol reductant ABC exporter subunit CydC [Leucobacter sp. W1153]|uniref:thiol reductant ABC exporter subunit CydC n=1 Tax=Leucobacter sp. W1153 TaxID=3439064 RepID=UPI003F2AAC42
MTGVANGIARVLRRATPPWRRSIAGIVWGILADASVVGLLALSMWLIVRAGEQPPILFLTFAIVGVRAFAIGRAAFRYVERLSSHDAALAQLSQLRSDTFGALIPRVPGAIESHRRGEVLAAFVDDVDQLQDHPLRVRQPLIVSGCVLTLSVTVLALVSPLAAAVLAALLLVSGALSVGLSARIAGESDRELSSARAALTDALLERFESARELAAYGAIPMQRERIAEAERRLAHIQLGRSRAAGITAALLSLAAGVSTLVILVTLAPSLGEGISAPLFAAAVIVPAAVFEVFAQVPLALVARRTVAASAARVAELTETALPAELPVDPADPLSLPRKTPHGSLPAADVTAVPPLVAAPAVDETDVVEVPPLLEVRDLEVTHPGASRPAVRGVSFDLRAGETLIVTGASGAGKSSLALALVRMLEYRGSYRVQGIEARRLRASDLREVVGLCEQTPHLFDADLRQNLLFARDTATDEELMAALDRVGLAEWAHERGGLGAPVGERGALVSGGQAGRIALARGILADFPVVILDEPTAGVDRELADRMLIDLLGAVPENRAVMLITHTELPPEIRATRLSLANGTTP